MNNRYFIARTPHSKRIQMSKQLWYVFDCSAGINVNTGEAMTLTQAVLECNRLNGRKG